MSTTTSGSIPTTTTTSLYHSTPGPDGSPGCADPEGLLAAYTVIIAMIAAALLFIGVVFILAHTRAVAIHKYYTMAERVNSPQVFIVQWLINLKTPKARFSNILGMS